MEKLGSLYGLEAFTNSAGEVSPGGVLDSPPALTLVMFHGYGADAYDLRSLSQAFSTGVATRWLFPQGPIEVPIGPGWMGRAWWNIDLLAIERVARSGGVIDLSEESPTSLPQSVSLAKSAIQSLGVPWSQIVLGGFSQGAMLATELFLSAEQRPAGLLSLSGSLIRKTAWKEVVKQSSWLTGGTPLAGATVNHEGAKKPSAFLSHGSLDAVLPVRGSQQLEGFLNSVGVHAKLKQFSGGHEIPPEVVAAGTAYLQQLAKGL